MVQVAEVESVVTDVNGQIVKYKDVNGNSYEIDIENEGDINRLGYEESQSLLQELDSYISKNPDLGFEEDFHMSKFRDKLDNRTRGFDPEIGK